MILACGALKAHVDAAQAKMGTNHPVVVMDRRYHDDPAEMRRHLMETMETLQAEADTFLVAMGYCGGSWENLPSGRRVVLPRVDDCTTLLLHTDDRWFPNLKREGHLYLRDSDTAEHSLEAMQRKLCLKYGGMYGEMIFRSMFANYTGADIIDTGAYDCYSEEYVAEMQRSADLINASLGYVEGSNRILEKLVSGRWDRQFWVLEPGQILHEGDLFDGSEAGKAIY